MNSEITASIFEWKDDYHNLGYRLNEGTPAQTQGINPARKNVKMNYNLSKLFYTDARRVQHAKVYRWCKT